MQRLETDKDWTVSGGVTPERRLPWPLRSSHHCKYPENPASAAAAGRTPATPDAPKIHRQTHQKIQGPKTLT